MSRKNNDLQGKGLTQITGKQVSCGVIALYCLNLPPHLRYNIENLFVIGITPASAHPDSDNLENLLAPIVEEFLALNIGVQIPTHRFPGGTLVRVRIAPVLADSPARALICGFMSHSAIHLCQFCTCEKAKIKGIDSTKWTLRTGERVRQQAVEWKHARTIKARLQAEQSNGVRWTSLHCLPYWDPVKHVVLGFMHNWLEGILQQQLRVLWGIGRKSALEELADEERREEEADVLAELYDETDLSESASEIDELNEEGSRHGNVRTQTRLRTPSERSSTPVSSIPTRIDVDIDMDVDMESSGSSTPTASIDSQVRNVPPAPIDEGH